MLQVINKPKWIKDIHKHKGDVTIVDKKLQIFYDKLKEVDDTDKILPPELSIDISGKRYCLKFFDGSFAAEVLIYEYIGVAE